MNNEGKNPDNDKVMKIVRTTLIWVGLLGILIISVSILNNMNNGNVKELTLNDFYKKAQEGKLKTVQIKGKKISGDMKPENVDFGPGITYDKYKIILPLVSDQIIDTLLASNATINTVPDEDSLLTIIAKSLPWILMFAFFYYLFFRQMKGSQKGIFTFGKSKAKLANPENQKITFDDVAGMKEPKEELQEVVDYLINPLNFSRLGGKIPKGMLVLGAPGTGKTLLAKAVAGEAGVPFFSMSGSDFVEMFVGVGASRVRDLFDNGKKNAPCIIFIDEIDAVGRHRGAGLGGGHDEREQTLNQLLVEMDGFDPNEGIIVLASTNRPDILDPALLRPGRFDRKIVIDRPDVNAREEIFKLHSKKIKADKEIDFRRLAELTPGMVGADIANVVNEAALLAARAKKDLVESDDFDNAKDKLQMGLERKSAVISDKERKISAYHESGHALVAYLTPGADPVRKISIIPRGMALGVTLIAPKEDQRLLSRSYLQDKLAQLLGGRAAEMIVFNEPTTGAADDIKKATELAHNMVCRWGMSETLGPLNYAEEGDDIFLGKEIMKKAHISEKIAETVDLEVHKLVDESINRAETILSDNIDKLHKLAAYLLDKEAVDGEQIELIINPNSSITPDINPEAS